MVDGAVVGKVILGGLVESQFDSLDSGSKIPDRLEGNGVSLNTVSDHISVVAVVVIIDESGGASKYKNNDANNRLTSTIGFLILVNMEMVLWGVLNECVFIVWCLVLEVI